MNIKNNGKKNNLDYKIKIKIGKMKKKKFGEKNITFLGPNFYQFWLSFINLFKKNQNN